MGAPSAPKPPDPKETAAAQTGTNLSTAMANATLGNVSQVTPYGNLTYSQTGSTSITDPSSGLTYDVPQYTATQTLSPQQQAIADASQQAQLNLANLASSQSQRAGDLLNTPFSLDNLPARANLSQIGSPQFQQVGQGPQFQNVGGGPPLQTSLGNYGQTQNNIADPGAIRTGYQNDFSSDRQRVEDALFSRLNDQIGRDQESLRNQLINQGFQVGTEGYTRAMQDFGRNVNDARTAAILNAGQEQSRLANLAQQEATFGNAAQNQAYNQAMGQAGLNNQAVAQNFQQNLAGGQFTNQARQQGYDNATNAALANNAMAQQAYQNATGAASQNNAMAQQGFANQAQLAGMTDAQRAAAMQEQYAARNQPINEITALMSGSQVTQPNFVNPNTAQMPTVDYAGLVNQNYQNQLGAYNQQLGQYNSLMGGLMGLGANALMLSDRRAKKDIKKVGSLRGHNLYEYRYKGQNGAKLIGLMAQEVEKKQPDAVVNTSSGMKLVDYGKALAS